VADRGGALMQVSSKDDNPAADRGIVGERDVAAKDANIARDRTVDKNISGEHAHAAGGLAIHIDGAEKAAGIMEYLAWRHDKVLAETECIRWGLGNTR
jgi:hypothetical protein